MKQLNEKNSYMRCEWITRTRNNEIYIIIQKAKHDMLMITTNGDGHDNELNYDKKKQEHTTETGKTWSTRIHKALRDEVAIPDFRLLVKCSVLFFQIQ